MVQAAGGDGDVIGGTLPPLGPCITSNGWAPGTGTGGGEER